MLRSLRIVKTFKLVNDISSLRRTFKGFVKAIPGILWTFCFLLVFAYVYAIIGTNVFGEEFPEFFGTLGSSFLTLCQIITFDSWVSQITRPIVQEYHWAWFYFVSYAFTAAYVLMNVIVGIIVDSMGNVSKNNCDINAQAESKKDSIETLSTQISDLQNQIAELKEILKKKLNSAITI
jgi:voltage-gated sodium channel